MKRRELLLTGTTSLSASVAGCLSLSGTEDKPWVNVRVSPSNMLLGVDSSQVLDIAMGQVNVTARSLPDDRRDHRVNIDVSPLEQYGVDVEQLSVATTRPERRGSGSDAANTNVDTVDITNGVIDLVVTTSENIHDTAPIGLELTGFQFTAVEGVTEITYDVRAPDEHVGVTEVSAPETVDKCTLYNPSTGGFKLINPQSLPPTLCPQSVSAESRSQRLSVEWLTPEADEMVVDIDVAALDDYGTTAEAVISEEETRGAVVETATIDGTTISVQLVPTAASSYAAVDLRMEEIEITADAPVEGLSYEMTVEGDAQEEVATESFDITEPEEPV